MKYLLIGDPHYRTDNRFFTSRMEQCLYQHLEINKYDAIVVLGDILDKHENAHLVPLTEAQDFLYNLSVFAPTYALIGNHDRINNRDYLSRYHPFTGVRNVYQLHIIDRPLWHNGAVFVPYVPENRLLETLNLTVDLTTGESADWRQARIIFCHQEINGAQMGDKTSTIDEVWPLDAPPVYSGHIHDRQQVQANWTYVGTPFPHNFTKTEVKRTISMVDSDTNTETILNLNLPRRKLEELTVADINKRLTSKWQPDSNILYKWRITGKRAEVQRLTKQATYLTLTRGFKLEYNYTDTTIPKHALSKGSYQSYHQIVQSRLASHPLALQYFNSLHEWAHQLTILQLESWIIYQTTIKLITNASHFP